MSILVQNISNTRRDFCASVETSLPEFLNNGWFISLGPGPSGPRSRSSATDAGDFDTFHNDRILVGWGAWREAEQPDGQADTCSLYAPDFYLSGLRKPWRYTPSWDLVDRNQFARTVLTAVGVNVNGKDQGFQWVEPARVQFDESFRSIRDGMESRGLLKGVPVVFATARGKLDSERKQRILESIFSRHSKPFAYGFWQSGSLEEGMIGVTPEVLFTQNSPLTLETMALAGTRAKQNAYEPRELLLHDPKERKEHQFVVDDLSEVLSGIGKVAVGSTGLVELPTLFHLKTRIEAELGKEFTFEEIVHFLHPTPALGLAPRALGFSEMLNWDDPAARWRFGAPFGVSYREGAEEKRHCVVAIRNIQWQDEELRLGSGCGIVAESNPDREWQELELKRNLVKRMLGV
jgi:isochorismate synthase EntC